VIDTDKEALEAFTATPQDNGMLVKVVTPASVPVSVAEETPPAPAPATSTAMATPSPTQAEELAQAPQAAPSPAPEPASTEAVQPPAAEEKPAWVNRIDFSSGVKGQSTLVVGTTQPVRYELVKVGDKKLHLTLYNTNVPSYRKRPLITTRFESAVDRITPVQKPSMGATTIMAIELREMVPYTVEEGDQIIKVNFSESTIPPKPFELAKLPTWKKVLDETEPVMAPIAEEALDSIADDAVVVRQGEKTKTYTGEKIALDFYNTDVKNVFRILREVSGKNFAIDKNVRGSVTLTLEKPVPWDQVLDLVLKMNQLGMVFEGEIIRIATLETIKKEDEEKQRRIEAARKAREEARLLEPLFTEYIAVNYSNARREVLPHVKDLVSKRGSITVDERNNQIIVTETQPNIDRVRALVRQIDRVTPQVIIESRIVEVNTDFSREFGINWGLDGGINDTTVGNGAIAIPGIGPQRGYDTLGGTYGYTASMNFPASSGQGQLGFNFLKIFGSPLVIDATITAIEVQGKAKVLSSPKILTLDNKKAKIKQGLEVAYLERDDAGGSSVKFKNVDLLLEVTPHITPDNRVSMSIFVTKNDVAGFVNNVPTISTNEAETELLVNDGDTLVIGGIIKATTTLGESGFPIAKDVPILGYLFKNTIRQQDNNELLIFITPRIVKIDERDRLYPSNS
jgi:type IV pilus assembly protein PilQ